MPWFLSVVSCGRAGARRRCSRPPRRAVAADAARGVGDGRSAGRRDVTRATSEPRASPARRSPSRPTAAQSSAIALEVARVGRRRAKPWTHHPPTRRGPRSRAADRVERGPAAASGRTPDVDRHAERGRVAPDLVAARRDDRQRRARPRSGGSASRLSSSANRAASRHVTFGPLPPTSDRDPRRWTAFGSWIASSTWACRPCVRRAARRQHPADDLEVVGQDRQPLGRVREAVAVGEPLVFLPAGPDAELGPPAADDVERRDHLGRQRRGAVGGGQDQVAEPGPRRRHRRSPSARRRARRPAPRSGGGSTWKWSYSQSDSKPERLAPGGRLDRPLPGRAGRRGPGTRGRSPAGRVMPTFTPDRLPRSVGRLDPVAHRGRRSRRRPARSSAIECHRPASRTNAPSVRIAASRVVPRHAHRLRPDVDAGPVQRGEHLVRALAVQHASRARCPRPTGWPWMKCRPCPLLEVVEEEVLDALDVARVPAGSVERRGRPSGGRP